LAKLLESREVVVAVTMDGEGPGRFPGQKITFVAAAPRFWRLVPQLSRGGGSYKYSGGIAIDTQ
jgi:hypothetical protein